MNENAVRVLDPSTEVRGETATINFTKPSDPLVSGESEVLGNKVVFAETQTLTKGSGEATDTDQSAAAQSVDWKKGDRRPLLFRGAVQVHAELEPIAYDVDLELAVDRTGRPLVLNNVAPETMTLTNARGETGDSDR